MTGKRITLNMPDLDGETLALVIDHLSLLPADEQKRLKARFEDADDLAETGPEQIACMALAVAACCFASESEFKEVQNEFVFLEPARAADSDLADIALFYLEHPIFEMFEQAGMPVEGEVLSLAEKRLSQLVKKLKSLAATS